MADEKEERKPSVNITFFGVDSAAFDIEIDSASPTMLLAVAGYLTFHAQRELALRAAADDMAHAKRNGKSPLVIARDTPDRARGN